MSAQKTITNDAVVASEEAAVQAVVELLAQRKSVMVYRWACEVCGMIHTGSLPTSCVSCGAEGSLVHQPDFHFEMNSRW